MILKSFLKSRILIILLALILHNVAEFRVLAESSTDEDKLDTVNGLSWAGRGLPFSKLVNINDSLIGSPVGKIVIDRHGEDTLGTIFKNPFASPSPGRFIVVSFWGSKVEGCFVKVILQSAPVNGQSDLQELVPSLLEIGAGEQIVQLTPNSAAQVRTFRNDYTYEKYENNSKIQYSSTWYMAENLFSVNADAANLLRNTPPGKVRARLTFANGNSKIFPIGGGTTKRWQETYGFNPSCRSSGQT